MKTYKTPFLNIQYALMTNPDELEAFMSKHNLPKVDCYILNGYGANVHRWDNDYGSMLALCINLDDFKNGECIDLLVHECMHIYQTMRDEMAERKPSEEFEAYSVQSIFYNMHKQLLKKLKNTNKQ